MIVEERIYTVRMGKTDEYLGVFEQHGLPIALEELGTLLGYFKSDIGPLNQVVHLWGYESLDDRARRRARLAGREDWKRYVAMAGEYLQHQESRVLIPTAFSPIR